MTKNAFIEKVIQNRFDNPEFIDYDYFFKTSKTYNKQQFLLSSRMKIGEIHIYDFIVGEQANSLVDSMVIKMKKHKKFFLEPNHDLNNFRNLDWFIEQYQNRYYFIHKVHSPILREVLENKIELLANEYKHTHIILKEFFNSDIDIERNQEWE